MENYKSFKEAFAAAKKQLIFGGALLWGGKWWRIETTVRGRNYILETNFFTYRVYDSNHRYIKWWCA